MNDETSKLVIDGNAFYELDMDCIRKKEVQKRKKAGQENGQLRADGSEKASFLNAVMKKP